MTASPARRSTSAAIAAIAVTTLSLAGCGSDEDAAITERPTAEDSGREVYDESCASCHGLDLRGTDEGPSFLSIVYEPNHHTDASFRSAILNGAPQHHWPFGDMEPVEGLSVDDVGAVISYVRAQQQRLGFEDG